MATTISWYLGIYAGGCVAAMIFFLTGRWPAVLEKSWRWPVIFLWPLVIFWPFHSLQKYFSRAHHVKAAPANANGSEKSGG